jgi:TetR/AcrR family transcriptional repressor of nem operon
MGRAPTFDRTAVLDEALTLFWRRGYAATSMRDVADATGLGPGSLYAAFGDKHGLFEAVLAHYRARVSARTLAPLDAADAGLAAIEAVFTALARRDPAAPASGCLITNIACELGPHDDLVRAGLKDALDGLAERLERVLTRAVARGEVTAEIDPGDTAVVLVALAQGLRVLARLGEPPGRLDRVVRAALASLRAAADPTQPKGSRHGRVDAASPRADLRRADDRR